LVAAAATQAPGRFRAVLAQVPFVDVLTTMLDPSLPLTITEQQEWGDPIADPAAYDLIASYSPYETVPVGDFPALLITTSANDTRVFVTEPAKWMARLRDRVTDDPVCRPLLMRTQLTSGHGGRSGRYQAWREIAWEWAVLLDLLGAADQG
jgi:oligopeptidase B